MTWPVLALGEVVTSVRNGIFARRPNDEGQGTPILRISAVRGGKVDLTDSRFVEGVTDEQLTKFMLHPGDLLITRYNGSRHLVGIAGLVPKLSGPLLHPDKLIRLVPDRTRIEPRFLMLQMQSPAVRSFLEPRIRTTAGQSGIAGGDVRSIPLVVPKLIEQWRIVDVLEDHLSRIDAAAREIRNARTRLDALLLATLRVHVAEAKESSTPFERIGNLATTSLGKMLDAKKATGEPTPYLANINVRWGRFDLDHLKSVPLTANERARLTMEPGDVIVCEGGEPGRCAVWDRENTGIAYQKALHRVRVHDSSRIAPAYLALMIREAIQSGRADYLFTGTTIKHLPQEKLRMIEIPVPDRSVQLATLAEVGAVSRATERLGAALGAASARGEALRRAVLVSAFEGKLTGRHTDTEVIEELAYA